ncbi:MAG: hypothetical protein LAP87_03480 [Acidobacteriia bacterium]|nr:hypothetical protein [Terriglobia bacterium]
MGRGFGQQAGGGGHLLLDQVELFLHGTFRVVQQQVHVEGTGLDIAERLAEIVYQFGQELFRVARFE